MYDQLNLLFGHPAYRLGDAFRARETGLAFDEVRSLDAVEENIARTDVLVVSRLWRNEWIDRAGRLRFIQSVSAGTEQFDVDHLRRKGVRLASAQGGNAGAVAEHALALILSLTRQLHTARDNQTARHWRGLVSDPASRELELSGRRMTIVGLGGIGCRIAALAAAFGMRVRGVRRRADDIPPAFDEVFPATRLVEALRDADVVVLACPLTPETDGLVGAEALAAMRPSAFLINVARGRVVDETALVHALESGTIAGAGLDCFVEEPLPKSSPLWGFENVVMTCHTAGETRACEDRVVDLLVENLARLSSGRSDLRNQVI